MSSRDKTEAHGGGDLPRPRFYPQTEILRVPGRFLCLMLLFYPPQGARGPLVDLFLYDGGHDR